MSSRPTVLSRASVYASLKSYDAPHASANSSSTGIPKNVQDSSLLSFWGQISNDMHRTIPRLDCKNTAGRPLSVADMTSRMQHRSLTLVGDCASKATPTKAASITPRLSKKLASAQVSAIKIDRQPLLSASTDSVQPRALSKRHQRSKRRRLIRRIQAGIFTDRYSRSSVDSSLVNIDDIGRQQAHEGEPQRQTCDVEFVLSLHATWNHYARNLLQPMTNAGSIGVPDTATLTTWVSQHVDAIELIGAHVSIEKCPKSLGYNSTTGIIVSQSSRVWNIVPLRDVDAKERGSYERTDEGTVRKIKSASMVATDETASLAGHLDTRMSDLSKKSKPLRMIKVPKEGTVFRVTITLDAEDTKGISVPPRLIAISMYQS